MPSCASGSPATTANQRNSHELTEQLREAGVGSELDVLRADARLAATEASLPQLQAQQTRARNRIATLLGQRADQLSVDLSPRELPAIAKALPIGDPASCCADARTFVRPNASWPPRLQTSAWPQPICFRG